MTKRKPLSQNQKEEILKSQTSKDGSIRCFISGYVISIQRLGIMPYSTIIY